MLDYLERAVWVTGLKSEVVGLVYIREKSHECLGDWPEVGGGRTVIASEFGLDLSPGAWPEVGGGRTARQLPRFGVVREKPVALA